MSEAQKRSPYQAWRIKRAFEKAALLNAEKFQSVFPLGRPRPPGHLARFRLRMDFWRERLRRAWAALRGEEEREW